MELTSSKLQTYFITLNWILISFHFSCWLDTGNGLIWAFVAPIICVLITNSVMFFIAIRIARRSIQKRGESGEKTMALIKGEVE